MTTSQELFARAQKVIPGGVNSPVRSFRAVGGNPIFFERGKGAFLYDVSGKKYLDYVCSWGPLILGHAHPEVIERVQQYINLGLGFGASTEIEVKLAELVCELIPSIEKIRMVNSGTEATMSAIRLARGYTKRDKFIKFNGCYHGHNDALLARAGSGVLTFGIPDCPGVPVDFTKHTLIAEFNDLNTVETLFNQYGEEIAAVIVEPVAGNMNCILPQPGFLAGLRKLCDRYKSLLIFDEVMTGFRLGLAGAEGYFNIKPDLSTFSKILGGGLPVGAYGGRAEIMSYMAPEGPVYQAGTLSGNPIAMSAGLATLEVLKREKPYERLEYLTRKLAQEILFIAEHEDIPMQINQIGSFWGIFFTDEENIDSFQKLRTIDVERFKHFYRSMLEQGVYLAPSAYETCFLSTAHTEQDIDFTLNAFKFSLQHIKKSVPNF